MTFRIYFASLALFCLGLLSTSASLAVDPDIKWRVLETPHFKIIYDSRHNLMAEKYALFAEQAFVTLVPMFKEHPRKTTLVLNDSTDSANGYATSVPYPLIMLYPVLPGSLDSISDYGNWGLELVTHEYTHTLNIEPAHGVFRPLRLLLGSIARPNMLLPRWYLEGLAVQTETQFSSFGRLRSANYLAIARAMVEQNTLRKEDISRINESTIPDWPGGARPYLLGALVWNRLVALQGNDVIYKLNDLYSRRLPFVIDGALQEVAQMDYPTLLDKTYAHTEVNAQKQIDQITEAGLTAQDRLRQKDSKFSHSPIVSPDGKKLIYIATDHRGDAIVKVSERDANESFFEKDAKTLTKGDSIQRLSWFPNSQRFVFDKIGEFKVYYEFSDLYVYEYDSKRKVRRLTKGMRAKEAVVSPDGEKVFFVQNTGNLSRLCSVSANGENFNVHYEPQLQARVSRPEFLNANEIIFSEKIDDGIESLHVFNLQTGEKKKVLAEYAPAHFPRLTSQGLLFVSDKSGVANVMIANKDLTSAKPVTNITTRAMTPEFDAQAQEYLYSHLYSEGPLIVRTTLEQSTKAPDQLPQVGPLVDYQWQQHTPPQVENTFVEKDYSVWPYMVPRYWMPWFYISSTGSFYSATTSSNDPLGKHTYSVSAFYDTYPDKPGFYGSYINQSTDITFMIDAADEYDRLTEDLLRHNTAAVATAAANFPGLGLSNAWGAGLGWRYDQTYIAGSTAQVRNGPQVFLMYKDYNQRGLEISPERGGAFKTSYTKFLAGKGNLDYERYDFNARYYFSKWLPERHVIAPSIRGTVEPGLTNLLLGPSSTSNGQIESTLNARHVMRGYEPSVFIGRNMLSASLEYRFPVSYMYRGSGTTPLFIKRLHGALFSDAITLDGAFLDNQADVYRRARIGGRMFLGAGGEIRADTTVGYHLPVTFTLGLYYGFDERAGTRSPIPFLGLQM